jgi:ABC-2 type transport system permease protein
VLPAFVRRDFATARSYRLPFILDGFYGVLNLAVYFFISRTFGDVAAADLNAPSYFAFAAVGIVMGTIIDTASDSIVYRLREAQLTGTLEALLVQPLSVVQVCLGSISFPALFAITRASLYLAIAAVWMDLDLARTSWLGLVLMLFLTGAAITAFGILAGATLLILKRGEVLASMLLFGMTILSGSVFPVSVLPDWLQQVSRFLPLRYALDGTRDALFGRGSWGPDALVLGIFALLALPVAVWIFGRALAITRRQGTVAQY